GNCLIVRGDTEGRGRKKRPGGPPASAAPTGPAELSPPANSVHNLSKRETETDFVKPAIADISGDLDRHGAARAAKAEASIKFGAAIEHGRHGYQRKNIVDDGRLAKQAFMGGKGRLCPDDSPLALEAVEKGRLLAADIGASAHPQLELEGIAGAENIGPEVACFVRDLNGFRKCLAGMGIFRPAIDVALGRADADSANRHAFDQGKRIAFHDHAVGKSAAIAFVGVADDLFAFGRGAGYGLPFNSGGEAGSAAPAQPRFRHFGDDRLRPDFDCAFEPLKTVLLAVIGKRKRVDNAAAGKGEAGLAFEKRMLLRLSDSQRM